MFDDVPWAFRAPGGQLPSSVRTKLSNRGYIAFSWDIDIQDYNMKKSQEVVTALNRRLRHNLSGGIVLLHENMWTTHALDEVVSHALAAGAVFKHPIHLLSDQQIRAYDIGDCNTASLHCIKFSNGSTLHTQDDSFDTIRTKFDKAEENN